MSELEIRLRVKRNSPLSIADALIDNENSIAVELRRGIVARERIRQIGMALLNYVDSDIAIEKYMAERCEYEELQHKQTGGKRCNSGKSVSQSDGRVLRSDAGA